MFANKNGDMFVFAVPPGLWKLDTVSQLNLCLGAPAFRVEAGDVVYAGSFDIAGPDIGPDMDMAPARTWLAGLPQEHALRPAAYVNGVRGFCSGFSMYALEVTGAPFVPGYRWGGAASAPPATKVDTPSATPATSPPVSDRPLIR